MAHPLREKVAARVAKPPRQKIEVPDWDFDVYVRKLGADEQVGMEAMAKGIDEAPSEEKLTAMARLCCLVLVDDQGQRVFTDEPDDIALMRHNPFEVIDSIWKQAAVFNKMTPQAQQETVASFGNGQSVGSPSA